MLKICEVLDLFRGLLKPSNRDQIFLLMFEPDMGELLYMMLINAAYPVMLREKVLQVRVQLYECDDHKVADSSYSVHCIMTSPHLPYSVCVLQVLLQLLRTDKVSLKDKVQLHLCQRDLFLGLVSLVQSSRVYISQRMLSQLIDIALLTGK